MIQVALWTAGSLLLIQLLLLVYILISKSSQARFEKKVEDVQLKVQAKYLSYISGDAAIEPRLPKSEKIHVEVLERLLNGVADNTASPFEKKRIQEIAQTHLSTIYQTKLTESSWADRINALYFIEEFMLIDLKEKVWEHLLSLRHEDEEYRQTLKVLASLQDERMINYIVQQGEIPIGLTKELFRRFTPNSFHRLLTELEKKDQLVPESIELAFIDYCGESGNYEFLSFIEKKIDDSRKEVRLRALRSLCQYQYCTDTTWIRRFFVSEQWEERMYAAKLTGIMTLTEYNDDLVFLAGDQIWWVRFAACDAIKKVPDGEILLEYISTHHEDTYARDMAQQTLTMREGHL
ncbi:hypothetical protein ACM26V_16760 [Salipaludibacillus sp. HK11]|uniref:hypothetical protein n=1 Tax=Salipaludibacillus sp. HK11 TaxID=3394320 RepID=UPI0039FBF2FC